MTRYNCRLQVAILSLVLHVLLLPGYSNALFRVTGAGVNDPSVKNSVKFSNIMEILSVTSPFPNVIFGDPSSKNSITYNGKLPAGCPVPVTVLGRNKRDSSLVTYTGTLTHNNVFDLNILPNAVGVTGDSTKLDALIVELSITHEVQVVSRRDSPPPVGNEEMAIVLVEKRDRSKHLSKQVAEDIIQNVLASKPQLHTLTRVTGNCDASCRGICKAVFTLDKGPTGVVILATVTSQNDKALAFLPTKWVSTCTDPVLGVCSRNTCYNGGSCAASRDSSPNICTCTPQTNLYGPRCQLLTRSYEGTGSEKYFSSHSLIIDDNAQPMKLSFSFEHAGKCQLGSGLCTIAVVQASGKQLLKVEEGVAVRQLYNTATLPVDEPAEEMTLYSDRMVQNNRWIEVTVHVTMQGTNLKATTVFCTKEANPFCIEKTVEKAGVIEKISTAHLSLGGHVRGCFRNVRFNGALVDLKVAVSTPGTKDGCDLQKFSCSSTCGDGDANSNCYGMLGSATSETCSCKCATTKRRPRETITLPTQCSEKCTTESGIISISGTGRLNWKGTNSASIPLNSQAPLTISFLLRTRQVETGELLTIAGSSVFIKLDSNLLSVCIVRNCYAFPSVPVNDGRWHEVFAMVAKTQLTVRLGDYSRMYIIPPSFRPVSGATVSMKLTNGCIRDVRFSGIYLPTSNADKTEEKDSSNSILLELDGSITAGAKCTALL